MKSLFRQFLIQVLILVLAFPPSVLAAGVVPDASAPANKRPGVDKAANGVPLVNITAPNKNGLSHNQYNQFDVDRRGLILNNSERAVNTQLGGIVGGNPNLGGGKAPAKTILNEVTGANRSHIQGYIEVGGQKADVILANPYGVTVNGGGFINVDRATITTGRPEMNGDKLLLRVEGGDVRIDGAGINASNITGFDVVSRAAEINATVHAKDLSITTGRNSYDPATRMATPLAPDGSTAPTVAIDSTDLGGMYAGRIILTSTEKGVGVNLDGVVQSVGDLEITADGKLAVKAAQAGGNMKLTAKGAPLEVKKAVVVEGNLSAKADRIDIKKDAAMATGLDLRLEAAQALNLDENAWAVGGGAVEVATNDLRLARDAALEGGSLKVSAGTIAAEGASLAGAGNLEITGETVALKDSSLAAEGVLWLDLTDALTVDAGSAVLGYGGLHVKADGLENNGLIYSGNAAELLLTSFLRNQGGADILTVGDLLITGAGPNDRVALVRNEHSYIESLDGSIRLDADVFENYGGSTATHEVFDGSDYKAIGTNLGAGERMRKRSHLDRKMPYEIWAYMAAQAEQFGTPAEGYKKTEGMQEWVRRSHDEMDEQPDPAMLIAGKNIAINAGEVRNTLSVISAGKDLSISADRLVNEGADLFSHRRTTRWIVSTYWKKGSGWSGGSGKIEGREFNYHGAEIYDTVLSLITAGRNVVLNLTDPQEGALVIGDPGDFAGRSHGTPALSDYMASGVADGGSASGGLAGLRLPGLGGLFSLSSNPNHPYIIETNPALTRFGYFYGSDYFLSRMGINLERLQMKLLGDAFYESRLIRDQITAMAGVRYLIPGVDDDAETIRVLMDNAVAAGQALDLSVGVALTPEQAARLDKDIVWLEEVDYNGQKALAPRLYLSSATKENLANLRGGTISGDNVVVQGQGTVNTGLIAGNTVKVLSTADVVNRGAELFGKDTLVVASDGSVINQSGTLRGKDVLVSAGKDIVNETLIERLNEGDSWRTESQQQGLITATNDLRLEASNDIRFAGARAEAGGTAVLVAGNDVVLESKAVEFGHEKKNDTASLTGQAGSYVSGQNVGIQAGRDITLSGSHVAAENDAQLTAGRDITLLSAQGESHMYSKNTSSGGFGRKSTEVLQRDETKALGSSVTAGGDVNLRAGVDAAQGKGNITGMAAGVAAGGDVSLSATGDIAFGAVGEFSRDYSFESSSSMISAKSHLKESGSIVHKGSEISGTNVAIQAGDNALISGGKVNADNDLSVRADTGDVVVSGVEDTYWSREEKKKSGFNLGDIGKTLVVGYLTGMVGLSFMDAEFYTKESEKSIRTTTVNSGSALSAGHNLRLDSNRDVNVIGSSVTADNDLGLFAVRDVNLTPGRESDQSEYIKKKTSIGMSNSWSESGLSSFVGVTKSESGQRFSGEYTAGSYVGAGNDVIIEADRDVNQVGSHIEAGRDVVITAGQDWNMLASYDVENLHQWQKTIQIGVSASLRQNVTGAGRTLLDLPENATAGRGGAGYSALTAASAGLRAIDAVKGALSELVSASATVGASFSKNEYTAYSSTANPSTVAAGRDVDVLVERDITIEGGRIVANENIFLDAGRDLSIIAARHTGDSQYSSSSGGAGVGVKAGFGSGGFAAGVNVSAQAAGAKSEDESTTHLNSLILAGDTVSTRSGRDTTVAGAHVEGDRVAMDVGRDLTVASLQDTYDRKASNWSAGADVTVGYGVMVGVNLGYGQGKSDMDWVGDQTAIVGRKEVGIYVEKNTHIKGAIIATEPDGNLTLNTGTLTYEELRDKNKSSDWNAGISASTTFGGGFSKGDTLLGMKTYDFGNGQGGTKPYVPNSVEYTYSSSDKRGVLRPTVTDGTIIVRDDPNTDLSGLNRDIERAREITKDEKTYVDVYVSKGAIEEIAGGFKGIRRDGAQAVYDVVVLGVLVDTLLSAINGTGNPDFLAETGIRNGVIRGMDRLQESSLEWQIKMSGERALTAEEDARLAETIKAVAAEQGLSLEQFAFYASKLLPGGEFNPGDQAVGLDGKAVGVNMINSDRETMVGGLEFLRRLVHETGHPLYGSGSDGAANALSEFAVSIYKNLVAPLNLATYSENTKHSADQWLANNLGSEALFWSNVTAYQMALSKKTENYPDPDPVLTQALMAHLGMITPEEAMKNLERLPEVEQRQAESVMVFNAGTAAGAWNTTWDTLYFLTPQGDKIRDFHKWLGLDVTADFSGAADYFADSPERRQQLQGFYIGGEIHGGILANFALPAGVEAGIVRGERLAMQLAGRELMIAANPATGNPAAIVRGLGGLNARQAAVLEQLEGYGSQVFTSKAFGARDLRALTAATGDEFAMFTTGGRRLIIRGNAKTVPIDPVKAQELSAQGWRWSSHVHPDGVLRSSPGDRSVLGGTGRERSAIFDIYGGRRLFTPRGDSLENWRP